MTGPTIPFGRGVRGVAVGLTSLDPHRAAHLLDADRRLGAADH